MSTYDELKISDSEVITQEKWNGLVEKVEERDHEIVNTLTITDGNVGIGTDTPTAKLHIVGENTDANGEILVIGPTNQSNLRLGHHADYSWVQSHGSKPLAINPKGNNVGIGTTTPAQKLHVNGGLQVESWIRVKNNTGIYFQDHGGGFHMSDATWIRTYGNKNFYHNKGLFRTDGELQVGSSGNRLVVKTDGNVGIGVTNPSAKLHVNGLIATNTKLIDVKRFNNLGDKITHNTGYSHAHWSAAVAGFYIQDGDINEKGAGNMIYIRMINKSGKWHIQADMRSHGNHENWFVDVMFIRKTISRTIGM